MTSPPTVMCAVFGAPKKKKTSDMLAAFPTALFIGVPSAITLVAQNELGYNPAIYPEPPQTLTDLNHALESIAHQGIAQQYGAIIIDDASHLCKRSMLVWQDEAPMGRSGRKDKFYAYQMLDQALLQLSSLSRHIGVHLAMTFHEKTSGEAADGNFTPGGPDVPSRNQVKTIPSWCDITVRAMVDKTYPDPWFPGVYYCDPSNAQWVTGDRTGVCWQKTPGNLREILRASNSGYRLDRLPGLEWQDDIADQVAERICAGEDPKTVCRDIAAENDVAKLGRLQLRWACQHGIARAVLRIRQQRDLFDFTTSAKPKRKTLGSRPAGPPTPT